MIEETYQEVVDTINENEMAKDEIPENPPGFEKCETIEEEKEENERTDRKR